MAHTPWGELPKGFGCHAVVVAGGVGTRFGGEVPKQFLPLGGEPIVVHTLRRFLTLSDELRVVLVLPKDQVGAWEAEHRRHILPDRLDRVTVAVGGATRTQSVLHGLQALYHELDEGHLYTHLVAIQDAVRPFSTPETILASYHSAAAHGSGVAAVPSKSSLRRKTATGSEAVDRADYYAVQTPQTFRLDWLWQAYHRITDNTYTDDASLIEEAGHPIRLVDGTYDNLKITTPEDLIVAEQLLPAHLQRWPYPASV